MANVVRRRFRVSGTVQGVGFRWWTQRQARSLGLTGEVRNVEDGSVEVEAEGPAAKVDRLAEELRNGPAAAVVTALEELPPTHRPAYISFEIGATGGAAGTTNS